MFDDIFDKQSPKRKAVEALVEPQGDETDDCGSFGWLRGVRDRAVMLEVRHKDGTIAAHSYAWLSSAEFDPSDGISLNFSGTTVKLIGRNLNTESRPNIRLFAGILRHRVPWVQEADGPTAMEASKSAVIIEEVKIK